MQVAAGSDFGKESEPSTSAALPEATVSAAQQSAQEPSTAGDALLAAQLQEEDQVCSVLAKQSSSDVCAFALRHIWLAASVASV